MTFQVILGGWKAPTHIVCSPVPRCHRPQLNRAFAFRPKYFMTFQVMPRGWKALKHIA